MKIYLDTNVVSTIAKDDHPDESSALEKILEFHKIGRVQLVTSDLTRQEIQKLNNPDYERKHKAIYNLLENVPLVEAQRLYGFNTYGDRYTWISSPLIEEDPTWLQLRSTGLDGTDAHHVMLAIKGTCEIFLTCDEKTILNKKVEIEKAFPSLRLFKPSTLVNDLDQPLITSS